ncbi:EAL domain-containing protein, partial [Dactylosporangium fulvum]|uniref:EAL domain-containing protein n=1 Tax=Dactylosporangium fulvum TaxID=53359 RepID=UPI0031D2E647
PFAGTATFAGLLILPTGAAGGPGVAARRGFDAVCVALWQQLTLLVLVLEVDGESSPAVFVTCLLAVVGLTVAVVSGVRAPYPRGAAVTTAAGVALLVLGLAVLPLLPSSPHQRAPWLLAAGGLLVLGSVLVRAGACRSVWTAMTPTGTARVGAAQPERLVADGTLIGDPLLVAPVLAGAAAVLYSLVTRGRIGPAALVVGLVAVLAVVLRELLDAVTVRRFSGQLSTPYPVPGTVLRPSAGVGPAPVSGGPEETLRRATLEQHLPHAVERGELDLAYHPVYDLVEGHPIGVEALLRWRHPRLGTIPPRETLEVARELGLTGQVHDWVLNRACRQLSLWQHEGYRLWMSVNVAFDDLVAADFASRLSLALDSHQVDPGDLVIELAERDFDADLERAADPLATVRAIGVRTALDGFGTGVTSLAHLRGLPTDLLKVDRSLFALPPATGGPVAPIIDVVVKLGQRLNVTVVAHGLEARQHLELVRSAGCRFGQGHFYGAPGPAERVEAALVHQRTW